jgi:hypothetical protein
MLAAEVDAVNLISIRSSEAARPICEVTDVLVGVKFYNDCQRALPGTRDAAAGGGAQEKDSDPTTAGAPHRVG